MIRWNLTLIRKMHRIANAMLLDHLEVERRARAPQKRAETFDILLARAGLRGRQELLVLVDPARHGQLLRAKLVEAARESCGKRVRGYGGPLPAELHFEAVLGSFFRYGVLVSRTDSARKIQTPGSTLAWRKYRIPEEGFTERSLAQRHVRPALDAFRASIPDLLRVAALPAEAAGDFEALVRKMF